MNDPGLLTTIGRSFGRVRGGLRFILVRSLLMLLTSLPPFLATLPALLGRQAHQPWFTDHDAPLPGVTALHLLASLPGALVPVALVTVAATVVAGLMLSAGAFAALATDPPWPPNRSALGLIRDAGTRHLLPLARLLTLVAALDVGALGVVWASAGWLARHGESTGWSAWTSEALLPAAAVLTSTVAIATVGTLGLLARGLIVLDARRKALRALWLALRLALRHPLAALTWITSLTLAAQLATGALLAAWRQTAPQTPAALATVGALWLIGVALTAWLWWSTHRLTALLWQRTSNADLRQRPDDLPYPVVGRVGGWLRRFRRARGIGVGGAAPPAT